MNTATTSPEATKFHKLLQSRVIEEATFMGATVRVRKLTTREVLKIQEMTAQQAKAAETAKTSGIAVDEVEENMNMLVTLIKMAVEGATDIPKEAFLDAPLDELTKLAETIMSVSGVGDSAEGK